MAVQPHLLLQLVPRADALLSRRGRGRIDRRARGLATIARHRDRLCGRGPRACRLDLPKRLRTPHCHRLPRRHVRRDVRRDGTRDSPRRSWLACRGSGRSRQPPSSRRSSPSAYGVDASYTTLVVWRVGPPHRRALRRGPEAHRASACKRLQEGAPSLLVRRDRGGRWDPVDPVAVLLRVHVPRHPDACGRRHVPVPHVGLAARADRSALRRPALHRAPRRLLDARVTSPGCSRKPSWRRTAFASGSRSTTSNATP